MKVNMGQEGIHTDNITEYILQKSRDVNCYMQTKSNPKSFTSRTSK
jgi:hypothetical protein